MISRAYLSRIFVLICILSTSLTWAQPLEEEEESGKKTLKPGRGVVTGMVELTVNGKKHSWKSGSRVLNFFILPSTGKTVEKFTITEEDGSFYWQLNPGDYQILRYEYTSTYTRARQGSRIDAKFTVPPAGEGAYIGTLELHIEGPRSGFLVKDDYAVVEEVFKKQFPAVKNLRKSMVTLKGKLGSYQNMRHICASDWGAGCTKQFTGVTPIKPKVGGSEFMPVHNLTPILEWKPSSSDNVTYDLVVYEAVSTKRQFLVPTDYLRGRILIYEEDIKEPRYQFKKPLQWKGKYYWSVRLRNRNTETVSNWTTYQYSWFVGLGGRAYGYGAWFGFSPVEEEVEEID